jgi:hypothetical protein
LNSSHPGRSFLDWPGFFYLTILSTFVTLGGDDLCLMVAKIPGFDNYFFRQSLFAFSVVLTVIYAGIFYDVSVTADCTYQFIPITMEREKLNNK